MKIDKNEVYIEIAGIHHNNLSVKLKSKARSELKGIDLSEVLESKITVIIPRRLILNSSRL